MGLFDTEEEKAAKEAARAEEERQAEERRAAQQAERDRRAFLATPVGQATVAKESSTERVFLSGENTSVSGRTVGIYLFRNTDHPMPATK